MKRTGMKLNSCNQHIYLVELGFVADDNDNVQEKEEGFQMNMRKSKTSACKTAMKEKNQLQWDCLPI